MIKIRKSVFETNSSSSHSLVFSKKNRGYSHDLPVDENGVLTIPFGEFGWGPEILKTPLEKLSYYITDHAPYIEDDDKMEWDELIKLVLEKSKYIRKAIEIIKTNCPQVREVKFEKNDSYWVLGYVDHQSAGTSNEIDFEDLVFNNNTIVVIDNDNSYYFYDYKEHNYGEEKVSPKCDPEDLFDKSAEEIREIQRNSFY